MPAVAKVKCECGCGQAPHSSTRQRLVRCACGNTARQSRECLSMGSLVCPCGLEMLPVCELDRACLPGMGEVVMSELDGRALVSAQKAEFGRLGGRAVSRRSRCKADGCSAFRPTGASYCRRHADQEMPF